MVVTNMHLTPNPNPHPCAGINTGASTQKVTGYHIHSAAGTSHQVALCFCCFIIIITFQWRVLQRAPVLLLYHQLAPALRIPGLHVHCQVLQPVLPEEADGILQVLWWCVLRTDACAPAIAWVWGTCICRLCKIQHLQNAWPSKRCSEPLPHSAALACRCRSASCSSRNQACRQQAQQQVYGMHSLQRQCKDRQVVAGVACTTLCMPVARCMSSLHTASAAASVP